MIPVYDGANFLNESINSALNQTYDNIEVIVVNDGSDDDGETEKIALSYKDQIKYISKENGGVSTALNIAIKNMNGEWLSWLSHDDLYYPQKIEKQVDLLNNLIDNDKDINIQNQVVFCMSELINKSGKVFYRYKNKINDHMKSIDYIIGGLRKFTFSGCTFLIPKSAFYKIGLFKENIRYIQDYDYWYRLLLNDYTFRYLPDLLVQTRIHSKQLGANINYSLIGSQEDIEFWHDLVTELYKKDEYRKVRYFNKICLIALLKERPNIAKKIFKYVNKLSNNPIYKIEYIFVSVYSKIFNFFRKMCKKMYFILFYKK